MTVLQKKRGFTLMEILAVISIMAILMVLIGNVFKNFGLANDVTNGAQKISDQLNLARQSAISRNQYMQVRFFCKKGSSEGYSGIGIFRSDSPLTGTAADYVQWKNEGMLIQEGKISFLPQSTIIVTNDSFSPLIKTLKDQGQQGTAQVAGAEYDWIAFYYKPDGGIALNDNATKLSLAVCQSAKFIELGGNNLPPNYVILSLDRQNGRIQIVRP